MTSVHLTDKQANMKQITSPRSHVCEYVIVCAVWGFLSICFTFNKIYQLKL